MLGATDVFTKPATLGDLVALVRGWRDRYVLREA
jgi:hypothetical protein